MTRGMRVSLAIRLASASILSVLFLSVSMSSINVLVESACFQIWTNSCKSVNQKLSKRSCLKVSAIIGLPSISLRAAPSTAVPVRQGSMITQIPFFSKNSTANRGPYSDQLKCATSFKKSLVMQSCLNLVASFFPWLSGLLLQSMHVIYKQL